MLFDFSEPTKRAGLARLTGGLYLAFVVASILAAVLGHIGMGSAQQLYTAISAGGLPFRAGLVAAFMSALLFALAAWGLYGLLRPVNKDLALLFLLLNAIGVAIQCASMLPLVSAMLQGESANHLQAFSATQLAGLGYLSASTFKTGFVTAQLFFGMWLFPLGYLVYKSGFLPKFLGVLLLLDGVGVVIWFLQGLLLPSLPAISYPAFALGFVAEVGLGLWLAIKGVDVSDESVRYA